MERTAYIDALDRLAYLAESDGDRISFPQAAWVRMCGELLYVPPMPRCDALGDAPDYIGPESYGATRQ